GRASAPPRRCAGPARRSSAIRASHSVVAERLPVGTLTPPRRRIRAGPHARERHRLHAHGRPLLTLPGAHPACSRRAPRREPLREPRHHRGALDHAPHHLGLVRARITLPMRRGHTGLYVRGGSGAPAESRLSASGPRKRYTFPKSWPFFFASVTHSPTSPSERRWNF